MEIEVYKGQTITYNEYSDKFECDITCEDKSKSTKRQSLVDVRKEIDTFIKLNLDFKPMKVLVMDRWDKSSFIEGEISAIRTDGKFVYSNKGSTSKSFFNKKDMESVMVFNPALVEAKKVISDKFEQAQRDFRDEYKKLCAQLKPVDISKYDSVVNNTEG